MDDLSKVGRLKVIPHTYDKLFREVSNGMIPVSLLRSITYFEAGVDPKAKNPRSSATGLFQIMQATLDDYNKRKGTHITREQLLDPEINTVIGIDLLERIATSYTTNHPSLLSNYWTNADFVALVVLGFVAGWSETDGVGKALKFLESRKLPMTFANVIANATEAGASHYLVAPGTPAHVQHITGWYFADAGIDGGPFKGPANRSFGGALLVSLLLGGIGAAIALKG